MRHHDCEASIWCGETGNSSRRTIWILRVGLRNHAAVINETQRYLVPGSDVFPVGDGTEFGTPLTMRNHDRQE
jgi:hypothetical protein